MSYSATIDVPDLAAALAFYGEAFGWREVARPVSTYAVVDTGGQRLGLMEKAAGSRPTPAEGPVRDYARHWTPVHLDVEVADFDAAVEAVARLGGTVEQMHRMAGRPPIAFCADPFGHGLCVVGPRGA